MTDFFYRTEDISPSEVAEYFVETAQDRQVIDQLKGRNPTVVVGSRGVGKSFLLRVAQYEMTRDFISQRVLPVYLTFVKSSLLQTSDEGQFRNWMLARICSSVLRTAKKHGLLATMPSSAKILAGGEIGTSTPESTVDKIVEAYEESWKNPGGTVDTAQLPSIENVRFALEDLAEEIGVKRFAILIDEAAHIFLPAQQRQFFTLFRDLRSHCVTCNATVYPGVTSFGDTFQASHDATMITLNRDVLSENYVRSMREIVEKQADSSFLKRITRNAENFAVLSYAASGNPRLLLKTVASASSMNSSQVNEVVREYYRSDVWSEHTALSEKYVGHKAVIDWGREFIETIALPDIKSKNDQYLTTDKATSAFIWVHRDAPAIVNETLRVLCYTGVLTEHGSGIRATRSEIGKRYMVNLGCLFALESTPASTAFRIAQNLTPKRMTEFGANHSAYTSLLNAEAEIPDGGSSFDLQIQLKKPTSVLDITEYQREKLTELKLPTVGDVLAATEEKLKEAHYIGNVRARRMRNAAVASVLEYLSG